MDTDPFLAGLKRPDRPHAYHAARPATGEVLFMLTPHANGKTRLTTVNRKLQPVAPAYHRLHGDEALVVRWLERQRERTAFSVEWGKEDADADQGVWIDDHAQLPLRLARCKNLVAPDGQPILVSPDATHLTLTLTPHADRGDTLLTPTLSVAANAEAQAGGQVADGGQATVAPTLLSDSFALAGHTLYAISPVGDNYAQLRFFMGAFPVARLEEYLSVLFSYIDHLEVAYDGHTTEWLEQAQVARPTIVIEKVDADHSLFLRLTEQAKGLPIGFLQRFDVSVVAHLAEDGRIALRPIERIALDAYAERLRKLIVAHAPSKTLAKQVYADDDGLFVVPEAVAAPFLLSALPQLVSEFELVGADKLRPYKVCPVQPKLRVSLSSGIDFLEGSATVQLADEQFTLQQVLAQYAKKRYVELSDGNRAIIDGGYMRRLERIFARRRSGKDGTVRVSFFDLPEVESLLQEQLEGEAFRHHRAVYEGFNALATTPLRTPRLKATLRPYQREGIKWMRYLYDNHLGGCLADDMGLGKTVQTIGLLTLAYPKAKRPTLIVMPKSLLFNWQDELRRFAPHLSFHTYYATGRNLDEAMKSQVILTTYAIVRNDIDALRRHTFHMVILDESQNIKNATAQTTQAALLLKADHRLALSGTPVENNLTELYSLFRFLNPTMVGSLEEFNAQYTLPIQRDDDKEALNALRRKIFPFMLRRLKKDVLTDLPDRIEQTLYVEMSADQAELYERRRRYYLELVDRTLATEGVQKSQFVMFQALSELRRIASVPESLSDGRIASPKLDLLMSHLMDAIENGHKVVVVFNFIAGLELAGDQLEAAGVDYCSMTGSTRDRRSVVERFQGDPGCRVMLMTLKTGGVGLNLTAADTVFVFEPWWNKAAEEQAINRLHRIGQKAHVLSYSLIAKESIEEKIQLLQQQKAELFRGLIGTDASSTKHLSEDDIRFILG